MEQGKLSWDQSDKLFGEIKAFGVKEILFDLSRKSIKDGILLKLRWIMLMEEIAWNQILRISWMKNGT